MVCNAQHHLAEVGGNLVMYHLEDNQSLTRMQYEPHYELQNPTIPLCIDKFPGVGTKNGIFIFLGQQKSQSTPGGRLNLRLVEPKSSDFSNAQYLVLTSFANV
jgi:hypothetical protein